MSEKYEARAVCRLRIASGLPCQNCRYYKHQYCIKEEVSDDRNKEHRDAGRQDVDAGTGSEFP